MLDDSPKPRLVLFIASGGSPQTLSACLEAADLEVAIAASLPGPIYLHGGLKLLPNFILPDAPEAELVVVEWGQSELPASLLAYVRATLMRGGQVLWVGQKLPESIRAMPLRPGQEIRCIDAAALKGAIAEKLNQSANAAPN